MGPSTLDPRQKDRLATPSGYFMQSVVRVNFDGFCVRKLALVNFILQTLKPLNSFEVNLAFEVNYC